MKTKKQLTYSLFFILGALIILNIISYRFYYCFDNTKNKDYSMSKATIKILNSLPETVTITAYFTKKLPPQYVKAQENFNGILRKYVAISKQKIIYQIIEPNTEELEREAMQDGIPPVLINVREKDKIEQQKAYLGAVIKYSNRKEVIPVIQNETAFEYSLTKAIKKLTLTNKPLIGVVQGHGEPSIELMQEALSSVIDLYNFEFINLNDSTDYSKYKSLIITAPKEMYSEGDINILETFLSNNGKLMINLEHNFAETQQSMQIYPQNCGLEEWLAKYGVIIEDNVVIDKQCGQVGVQQRQGNYNMTIPMAFPYFPIITNFAEHPITEKMQGLLLMFPASIQYTGNKMTFTPLILSSEASAVEPLPAFINLQKKWQNNDFTSHFYIIGGILEGKFGNSNNSSSVIVFADGDYAISNGKQKLNPDNMNLFANSIDWLSDDTGLIELRAKGFTYSPINDISDSKKLFLKWLNFTLPIALIIIYGLINLNIKRNKRIKRMEEAYVK